MFTSKNLHLNGYMVSGDEHETYWTYDMQGFECLLGISIAPLS